MGDKDTIARNLARKATTAADYALRDITPFTSREVVIFSMLHDTFTTSASTAYVSHQLNVARAKKVTVFLQSNNQGTLSIQYSIDGTKTITTEVQSTPDGGKYNYKFDLNSSAVWIKYTYTETASAGQIHGGVQTIEGVVM